jgi:cytidylate kinase
VLDGRDVGTVVCPDATAKLFVTADMAVRAQRRHKELLERASAAGAPPSATAAAAAAVAAAPAGAAADGSGPSGLPPPPTYEQVLQDMQQRDARDASRAVAPCVPAEDALVLDTTHLSPAEVLDAAVAFVRRRMAS